MEEEKKKDIAVIGREDFTVGFRLAGVRKVFNPDDYGQKIEELLESDDFGIIVTEQEEVQELPSRIEEKVKESVDPVVVPLSEKGTSEQINEKIRKVIGADIT